MSRIACTVKNTTETTLFLSPSEFLGLNDLEVIIAIERELGEGNWSNDDIAAAAARVIDAIEESGDRT